MLAIFYCILCLSWTCTMLLWDVLMILYLWNTFKNFEETTYHLNCYILKWYKCLFLLGASHAAHIFHVLYNIVFTVWPQYLCEYNPKARWQKENYGKMWISTSCKLSSKKIFRFFTGKVQWGYNLILPDLWNLNIKYIDSNILKSKYFQKSNSDI